MTHRNNDTAPNIMAYNFDLKLKSLNFTIEIDTAAKYGYFEHDRLGEEKGGGLWFVHENDKLDLTDYDGVACLPLEVIQTLRTQPNITVSEDFE